jgi:hypothetical protein
LQNSLDWGRGLGSLGLGFRFLDERVRGARMQNEKCKRQKAK